MVVDTFPAFQDQVAFKGRQSEELLYKPCHMELKMLFTSTLLEASANPHSRDMVCVMVLGV